MLPPNVRVDAYNQEAASNIDVLWVVDNSGSMAQEQTNLKTNFPRFIEKLRALPGGLPDVHIAVVSSDVGAGGTTISGNPACNRPGGDKGRMDPLNRGMSCGVNAGFHYLVESGPKILIMVMMFVGRVGTVTAATALALKSIFVRSTLRSRRLYMVQ